jgi:hypothetical protein
MEVFTAISFGAEWSIVCGTRTAYKPGILVPHTYFYG